MQIVLHDSDASGFPNLALMKISAFYKQFNMPVSWYNADNWTGEVVYSSRVFTYNKAEAPPNAVVGGSGYREPKRVLPDIVEHTCPDYELYGINYSLGFLTRGCPRKCPWCIVPEKEGDIHAHADIEEFTKHANVVLMDNNILASDYGIAQIEKIARLGLRVDFNQGLDARLIDDGIARRLAKLKWLKPLRLACDHKGQISSIQKAVELLRWHNAIPRRYFCYVLVKDIEDALERIRFLKGMDLDPFAQPYIPPDGSPPTREQRRFARWVNLKMMFKKCTWEEYQAERGDRI